MQITQIVLLLSRHIMVIMLLGNQAVMTFWGLDLDPHKESHKCRRSCTVASPRPTELLQPEHNEAYKEVRTVRERDA